LLPTGISPDPARSEVSREEKLPRADVIAAWVGLEILAFTIAGVLYTPASMRASGRALTDSMFYGLAALRLDVILGGVFLAAFFLAPAMTSLVRSLRQRWRNAYTYGALLGICVFLCVFVIHVGRWQFGGYDMSIIVETGWRQVQGQRPYVDFPTTTPPGFNLGIKFAYQLFGVSWDANLYFTALFACQTFVWMYWLMVRLSVGRLAAMGIAFAIECAGMLTLCYWWYNDCTLILSAVFLLSCLVYARQPRSAGVEFSYFLSLTLLSVMKPNIASVTIVGGVVLLFLVTGEKVRMILLTLGAAVAAVSVLMVNHVSIPAMLASYVSVAKEHGGLSAMFGYREMHLFDQHSALFWVAVVSVPLFGIVSRIGEQVSERDWKGIALSLFFPLALIIALYGLATNGEYRDVECTVLLAAGGALTFGLRWNGPLLRRVYIAIVFASIAGDLYYGAIRTRVYGIGTHLFFEWQDNQHRVENGYLKNMRVSAQLIELEREISAAKDENPGPYFFGPRLEFNYAAQGLPSPEHSPAWWEPGTAFEASDNAHLIQVWQEHQFETLIFLKTGFATYPEWASYMYYPDDFKNVIKNGYVRDERYPSITVYHRRVPESGNR
jgi:hypothetical protein